MTTHRIVLELTKTCDDGTSTPDQIREMIEKFWVETTYGETEILEVTTFEDGKKTASKSFCS